MDEVTAEQVDGTDGFGAPDGSTLLPVGMSFETFVDAAPWGGLLVGDGVKETSVEVIVDGGRHLLGEPYAVVRGGLGSDFPRSF